MTIDEKVQSLGIHPIYGRYYPLEPTEIKALEKTLGYSLPEKYKDFVSRYGCSHFPHQRVQVRSVQPAPPHISDSDLLDFSDFLGGGNQKHRLLWHIEAFRGRMAPTVIPIASDHYGNLFCLGLGGDTRDRMYLWDLDNEPSVEDYLEASLGVPEDLFYSNMILVAKSFRDFVGQMEIVKQE